MLLRKRPAWTYIRTAITSAWSNNQHVASPWLAFVCLMRMHIHIRSCMLKMCAKGYRLDSHTHTHSHDAQHVSDLIGLNGVVWTQLIKIMAASSSESDLKSSRAQVWPQRAQQTGYAAFQVVGNEWHPIRHNEVTANHVKMYQWSWTMSAIVLKCEAFQRPCIGCMLPLPSLICPDKSSASVTIC